MAKRVQVVETGGPDITVKLVEEARPQKVTPTKRRRAPSKDVVA
jgi:hypothetical protein